MTSSLEVGLRVQGNSDEFPFPLQVVSARLFSSVIVAFPAHVQLVRKTFRHIAFDTGRGNCLGLLSKKQRELP